MTETPTERLPGKYIRGHQRAQLVRDLALGVLNYEEIADKYGRAHQTVKEFAARNKAEIARVKAEYGSELSVLWVANKFNRMATLQQYLEDIHRNWESPDMDADQWLRSIQVCQKILRDVAEEIGDLPTRARPMTAGVGLEEEIGGWDEKPR